jgi:DNA-binding GntR family transcriptional regulator
MRGGVGHRKGGHAVVGGYGSAIDRFSATLREQVLGRLQEQILSGAMPAGSRLNESEIAVELKVSRGPVREAIQRLASDGLVVMEPHRGAYVRSLTAEDVAELYEMRIALEVHATRLTARNAPESLYPKLRQLLDQTSVIVAQGGGSYQPNDLDIHQAIISGCGVQRLERSILALHKELALARARSGYEPARAKAALKEHRAIVRAIGAGDEKAAAEAMYEHLQAASTHTKALD